MTQRNAENDVAVNQLRALAQLACVLAMLLFTLSFVENNVVEEARSERERFEAMAKFYATKSSESLTGSESTAATTARVGGRRSSTRSRSSSPSKRSTKSSPGRAPTSSLVFV